LLLLHRRVQAIEIREVRDVALNAGGLSPYLLHGRIELVLPAARDEHVGALRGKPARRGEANPAVASGYHRDLSFQPLHRHCPSRLVVGSDFDGSWFLFGKMARMRGGIQLGLIES